MTLRGKVENGNLVLDEPLALPEGTIVNVQVEPLNDQQRPSVFDRYRDFIGIGAGLPEDLSANHDHYAHGSPKGIDQE